MNNRDLLFFRVILNVIFFLSGFIFGCMFSNHAAKVEQTQSKQVLQNHANEVQNIRSESDSLAIVRFKQNFGTK